MVGLVTLIKLAERGTQDAFGEWQRLDTRRDDARVKLARLQEHWQRYRELMLTGLQGGIPAASVVAQIGFIAQIEAVVTRQQSELEQLEAACAQHWEMLVNARRKQRIYEVLSERIAAREAVVILRQQQVEIGEILQRAAIAPPPVPLEPITESAQNG